jgi:hypothetical protein
MGRAYSQDLRERVMAAVESGTGAYVVYELFEKIDKVVENWLLEMHKVARLVLGGISALFSR